MTWGRYRHSPDFPILNAIEGSLSAPPNADVFLTKIAASGPAVMYSTYLGLKGGAGVAADGWGQAYVTGGNVLAARLNRAGSKLLSAFWALGGNAIALDRSGYAYITGETYSHLLPTFNAYQPTLSWGLDSARSKDDAFLVKISDAPAPPPTAEETDARLVYTGTWQSVAAPVFSGGRAVFSESGAATITFTGTGIQLIGRRDDYSGSVGVTLDSRLMDSLDAYAFPIQNQSLLLSITGLGAGIHTLQVYPLGYHNSHSRGNRLWIDGFTVLGETP